jgi:hypothetical protein
MYSARYGNIYTIRQLLQLSQEATGEWSPAEYVWSNNGKYYDALRPAIEPDGYDSPEEVVELRQYHLSRVRRLFEKLDIFIFTLGLTEMWVHAKSGTVYPTAPGTIAGDFNEQEFAFKNAQVGEMIRDFNHFQQVLLKMRQGRPYKVMLTVSPVPLTASASGKHVLVSTTYSKSALRCVADQLSMNQPHIDYFPSYEIITNPRLHSTSFAENLRSVRDEAVENVMRHFFLQHKRHSADNYNEESAEYDLQCEEALLDAFSVKNEYHQSTKEYTQVVGNSHLGGFKMAAIQLQRSDFYYYPRNWMIPTEYSPQHGISLDLNSTSFREEYRGRVVFPPATSRKSRIVFVGMGMFGDGIVICIGGPLKALTMENGPTKSATTTCLLNELPIVTSEDEISREIIKRFERNITRNTQIIEAVIRQEQQAHFNWVSSPMPSETCAIYRFGLEYVMSRSQAVYNRAYMKIAKGRLGRHITNGSVLLQDENTIAESGFTKDEYRASEPPAGVHASERYYLPFFKHLPV